MPVFNVLVTGGVTRTLHDGTFQKVERVYAQVNGVVANSLYAAAFVAGVGLDLNKETLSTADVKVTQI